MNSVSSDSDLKSCEMAGLDDGGQSGAAGINLLDGSFMSDQSSE